MTIREISVLFTYDEILLLRDFLSGNKFIYSSFKGNRENQYNTS